MAEFDPMEELGFTHDKQLVCGSLGFLQMNNSTRDVCKKFIKNGDRFYDLVSRYEDVVTYVMNRDENRSGNTLRHLAPFLKAFGATDFGMLSECRTAIRTMPEAKRVMNYITDTLPTFLSTSSLEHNVMALCEEVGIPISICDFSSVNLDDEEMSRSDARAIRGFASDILALKLPTCKYRLNVPVKMGTDETKLIEVMDRIFGQEMKKLDANKIGVGMKSVGANEKAYALLDLRKRTMIDFEGTAYIGGNTIDYQSMDLVRDGGGMSISYNGSEFAVHGCNIAVMSRDCTAAAVLVEEFYNRGIEAVYDLVENWNRESLGKRNGPDRNLIRSMLASNPKKLPEVCVVNKDNAAEVAEKSENYRKKLLTSYY